MKKYRRKTSPRSDLAAKGPTREEIEEAIQRLAEEGLIVDSGERRWSARTGRYEIVWKSKIYEPPN
jgi:biotin operon repressor